MNDPQDFYSQQQPPPAGQPPRQFPIVGDGSPHQPESRWKKLLGPLAGAGVVIAKFFAQVKFLILPVLKFLPFILKTGGSMIFVIWIYAMMYGWKWAVGFVVLIFIHECGHLLVARWFGLKVGAPVFIPFMGAFIALKEAPRDAWMEASVGIGGPVLGTLGSVVCHALGLLFDSPLLVSLAYTGYFLNLFNLVPIGQLDGGRVATALSPWMWIPGLFIMVWMALTRPNFIVYLILLMSIPRIVSLFRRRTPEQERYFEVTPARRAIMATMYFGLIAFLLAGMYAAMQTLNESRPMRKHSTQVAQVEKANDPGRW